MPYVISALAVGVLINFLPIFLPFLENSVSFLGWALPLGCCGIYLFSRFGKVSFPLVIWFPWICWVLLYLLLADAPNAFQRSIMLLTPFVVGVAFSTIHFDFALLAQCKRWLMIFIGIYIAASIIARGSGAAGVITASLLAAWLAAGYILQGRRADLALWIAMAVVPVISVTRMGILAVGATLPTTLAPISSRRRLTFSALLTLVGLGVFQMEFVQEKMFISGRGAVEQAFSSGLAMLTGQESVLDDDLRTNARRGMTLMLKANVEESYWFGRGANAVEEITRRYFGGLTHPHNDWLRLQHDYGTLGMAIFALAMVMQMLSAWRVARKLDGESARFMFAGASAFIPMSMFMLTDNVIMYVAWFGNLHFAMLGIGYAALRSKNAGLL